MPTMPKPLIQSTPVSILPLESRIDPGPIPPYHEPFLKPLPRSPDETTVKDSRKDLQDSDTDRKIEFEENSPHQEGIISETYERAGESFIQEPPELKDLINTSKLIQKVPTQANRH